ncbi:MAG: xanthine dehydrogenase family protein subunit M [Azonexus sp.]|jgi:carbon-monoxide dehydrogenase medium subunit|nr:xanthine dehydrogenase family protein subunit M [Azonexus sp.]
MYPAPFRYHRPASLREAVQMLSALGEGAKPLAGGQTLIPILKLRLDEPSDLVDIGRLPDLRFADAQDGWVRIGALSPHGWVARSDAAAAIPIVKDCAGGIADAQVRSRGTIGGSVSAADPNCDWPAMLRALDAEIICFGPAGERTVPIEKFVLAPYTTALTPGELVTAIRFKAPAAGSGGAYIAYKKSAAAFPICSTGVQLTLDSAQVCRDVRIVLGGAGPTARRALEAEAELRGKALSDALWARAADAAIAIAEPNADVHGSAEYKRSLLRGLLLKTAHVAMRRSANAKIEGSHVYA